MLDLLQPIAHGQKALLMVRRSLKHNGAVERGGAPAFANATARGPAVHWLAGATPDQQPD